jgi:hypothetical protein
MTATAVTSFVIDAIQYNESNFKGSASCPSTVALPEVRL